MNDLKRILIVDDADLVRRYYRMILEKGGYVVDEALNGIEALEKLSASKPDLLIVDVNMPQMDGLTFISALRRRGLPASAIPTLVTTTESKPEDRVAARKAGANYFLVKPIDEPTLLSHVALLCGRSP